MTDNEKKLDELYKEAEHGWQGFLTEAKNDLELYHGDQWPARFIKFLKDRDRNILTFPSVRRTIHAVSGYERKNRLSLKIMPIGEEDDKLSGQYTKILMQIMGFDGYDMLSNAFKFGSLITGSNLIELYPDENNDIQVGRWGYNSFLLDPMLTKLNLKDCNYLITGKMLKKKDAANLVPSAESEIMEIPITGSETSSHFRNLPHRNRGVGEELAPFEGIWERTTQKQKYLLDRKTGREISYWGKKEDLNLILQTYPELTVITKRHKIVELTLYYNGKEIWNGKNPYGIEDYPFIWVPGYFTPEGNTDKWRLQGMLRASRDAQVAENIRLSQMIDIFESQLMTGDDFEQGALVDNEDAFKTGQGQPRFFSEGALSNPTGPKFRERRPVDIPAGMFQLHQIIEGKVDKLVGLNDEIFGAEEKDIPGIAIKLRQGSALTIMQELFDILRLCKRMAGRKGIRMIQRLYDPAKVLRILNEPPAEGFYGQNLALYDCVPTEAMLTETQRQLAYAELQFLKDKGAPIPWSAILDTAPIQLKDVLRKHVQSAEQQQNQMMMMQAKIEQLQQQLTQAQIVSKLADAQESRADSKAAQAEAAYRLIKTAAEAQKIQAETVNTYMTTAQQLAQGLRTEEKPRKKVKSITKR